MGISTLALSILLFSSFLWGSMVGIVYDVNKTVRFLLLGECTLPQEKGLAIIIIKKALLNSLIFIQDLIAFLSAAVGLILLNYYYNDGDFRLFTLLAAISGFAVYRFTVGKLLMYMIKPSAIFLRNIIIRLFMLFILPIRLLLRFITEAIIKLFVKCKKHIEKNRNLRYNKMKRALLFGLSEYGFGLNDK